MEERNVILITGGVRSGKSSYAEQLAIKHANEKQMKLNYVACGVAFDAEMKERITRHQVERSNLNWTTWEQPLRIESIVHHFSQKDLALLDCVTTLLNNYLFLKEHYNREKVHQLIQRDIVSLAESVGECILVSNEVFQDIPYEDALTKDYQYILGKLHQEFVYMANTAILVESGIPICKKGSL